MENRAAVRIYRREQILWGIADYMNKGRRTIYAVCKEMDSNFDCKIDLKEFGVMLDAMHVAYSPAVVKQVFYSICDKNENGSLEPEELELVLKNYLNYDPTPPEKRKIKAYKPVFIEEEKKYVSISNHFSKKNK